MKKVKALECDNPFLWFKHWLDEGKPSRWTKEEFNEAANEFLNEFGNTYHTKKARKVKR